MRAGKCFLLLNLMIFPPCLIFSAIAKDFGSNGHSFKIIEESFLEMIQRKLSVIDVQEENKKFAKKVIESVKEPKAVFGIKRANQNRNYIFDPSMTLKKDITYPNGRIMHKAGKKINPLDHMDFDRELYFIDASDKDQVKWLKESLKQAHDKEKIIILVRGKIFDLEEELERKIYFDQFGYITRKMGIKAVPAFAYQKVGEKVITVSEYKI